MKNNKILRRTLIIALVFCTSIGFAQNNKIPKEITDYLTNSVEYTEKIVVSSLLQDVIKADIFEAELSINIGDPYNNTPILHKYFLKTKKEIFAFESTNSIISSAELIENLKKSRFKLKTEEDGIAFQTFLCSINKEDADGFFKIENTWYFIVMDFFDVTGYEVKTDNKGIITEIICDSPLDVDVPDEFIGVDKNIKFDNSIKPVISKEDSDYMRSKLNKETDYTFDISEIKLSTDLNISNASFYNCILKFGQVYSDGSIETSEYKFNIIGNDGKYDKCRDGKAIVQSRLFFESIKDDFRIKTKQDAKIFQNMLDAIDTDFDDDYKKFFIKDDIWIFVRKESWDDLYSYMLKTDNDGKIQYYKYDIISEENILSFKMKDKNFKVDYKFTLVTPTDNSIVVKKGQNIDIEISFDEKMVNAKGAWILTRLDGKNVGMSASTSMESPFTDEIPFKVLTGKNHTVEYFLLLNGGTDTEHPLAVIKINIEVE